MKGRVAVTGATGFVGGQVVRHLADAGYRVLAFGRRPLEALPADAPARTSASEYTRWDIGHEPLPDPPSVDAVVHCAARVDDWGPAAGFERVNVLGTRHVLETWPQCRFVQMSSTSIYDPDGDHSRILESHADPTDWAAVEQIRWLAEYSRTKRLAECEVMDHAGDRAILLRPHGVYGPGDSTLLPRLVRRYRLGRLIVAGSYESLISLTAVANLTDAVQRAIESTATGAFNIADPEPVVFGEALEALLEAMGLRPRVTFLPVGVAWRLAALMEALLPRSGAIRPLVTRYELSHLRGDFVVDTSKARRELGWTAPLDSQSALEAAGVGVAV